ncbi:hypothetical protein [Butyricimonas synergistica]|uniref:hypothetical protein n=1 Tax=Butyricimonas synergistica TaxID=544644 RepID=UPI0022E19E5B|nr:hypothetical protein [Butyricimonas synergistica]
MPKILLSLITGISNALGDVVYYMVGSNCYMRRKGAGPSGDMTDEQVAQQNIMATLGRLSSMFDPITSVGLKHGKCTGPSAVYNNFVHYNRKNVTWDAKTKEVVVNFSDLVLSRGTLYSPDLTVTLNEETRKIIIEQEGMVVGAKMNPDDDVFAGVFDMKNEFCILVPLRKREESGSTSVIIPDKWDIASIVVYGLARDVKKKHCSPAVAVYGIG